MILRQTTILLFVFIPVLVCGQKGNRTTEAVRITNPPKIDGILNDSLWYKVPFLRDFIQWDPYNGSEPSQYTEAWVAYDDEALYIAALCYDNSTDSIMSDLCPRDSCHNVNTEIFAVHISTYNDGLNSLLFDVTPAGVQRDMKFSGDEADVSWDAVWESSATVNDKGWSVEIKIPFSALRFTGTPVQDWGFNLWRFLGRKREWSCWSYVSNQIDCWWKESGLLQGVSDLEPPIRLSFIPYISGYLEKDGNNSSGYTYNGGLDVKYGLTRSFTLDMTLIPDFGQVRSDEERLNLSPYEIYYSERRPFFMYLKIRMRQI